MAYKDDVRSVEVLLLVDDGNCRHHDHRCALCSIDDRRFWWTPPPVSVSFRSLFPGHLRRKYSPCWPSALPLPLLCYPAGTARPGMGMGRALICRWLAIVTQSIEPSSGSGSGQVSDSFRAPSQDRLPKALRLHHRTLFFQLAPRDVRVFHNFALL